MKKVTFPELPILVVDDEEQFRLSLVMTLNSNGINHVIECGDSHAVLDMMQKIPCEMVLLDLAMPGFSGSELLPEIVKEYPRVPVIILTAINEVNTAVECMKCGAFDYLVKPVDENRLVTTVRRAAELLQVQDENSRLKEYLLSNTLKHPQAFSPIITAHASMRSIFQYAEAVAATPLPVLITGETGVGKELIAKAVHAASGRTGQFVAVNVAGIDDTLFSDTLFGHRRGAFTGAESDRKGLIEQATDGTLFLDEIGEMSQESQVKLLRILQEGRYYPIGSDIPRLSNARIIVATNRQVEEMVQNNTFRRDLYYRLQTHRIHIPPLRERRSDIPLLVEHFTQKACVTLHKKAPAKPPELFILLNNYLFPGNVRELEGIIFDAISRHQKGILSLDAIRERVGYSGNHDHELRAQIDFAIDRKIAFGDVLPSLKEIVDLLIQEALARSEGNQTIAARMIGITRRALNNRLHRGKSDIRK
ncbi:MAG TPA: sigma-54 dependent transcriptional regulator [bacterium]|nr:sigma-54 dependent transcriptional regulator [bacterium]HPG46285.1 sigma-54 dependent transcriptional regulator [bacterium]HPM98521.1 sigma-54 dependent transcriptional regulator [bacterium]